MLTICAWYEFDTDRRSVAREKAVSKLCAKSIQKNKYSQFPNNSHDDVFMTSYIGRIFARISVLGRTSKQIEAHKAQNIHLQIHVQSLWGKFKI